MRGRNRPRRQRDRLHRAVQLERLPVRAHARSVGDDGGEPGRTCRRLEQHLAAHRQPDRPDPAGADVFARLQVVDRCVHVAISCPAELVRVTTLALAAAAEEEDAVAVADEHAGVLPAGRSAGKAMTAAPFLEGTYQPWSVSLSLVRNWPFS